MILLLASDPFGMRWSGGEDVHDETRKHRNGASTVERDLLRVVPKMFVNIPSVKPTWTSLSL